MASWTWWVWLICFTLLELLVTRYAWAGLSLTLCGILINVGLLFSVELDLLAAVVLTSYASVFILLALLITHFGITTAAATQAYPHTRLGFMGGGVFGFWACGGLASPYVELTQPLFTWGSVACALE